MQERMQFLVWNGLRKRAPTAVESAVHYSQVDCNSIQYQEE